MFFSKLQQIGSDRSVTAWRLQVGLQVGVQKSGLERSNSIVNKSSSYSKGCFQARVNREQIFSGGNTKYA